MRRIAAALSRWARRLSDLAFRILDTVPPIRRTVDEVIRVELIDRAMVIAAQALLALIPLAVVLAAFVPEWLTEAAMNRFQDVTGLAEAKQSFLDAGGSASQTAAVVPSTAGFVGLAITIVSASSFARAVMRAYERVWDLPYLAGVRGRLRRLWWLLGWLVGLALLALPAALIHGSDAPLLVPLKLIIQALLASAVWWWTMHVLLSGRVGWRRLWLSALLTGVTIVIYSAGSTLVMPTYAVSSVRQFGGFGLVLAVATWLIGAAVLLVASAIVGHVLVEDRWTRTLVMGAARTAVRYLPASARGLRAGERRPSGGGD